MSEEGDKFGVLSYAVPPYDISLDCPSDTELLQDRTWWKIYDDSFPVEEREPTGVILNSLRASVGLAFRARRGSVTVGLATTHLLREPAGVFLVYLAVDSAYQDAGYGGALLEYAWSLSASRLQEQGYSPLGLVWEVDGPDAAANAGEENLRWRRISFFRRHGGVLLSRPYRQPPVNGNEAVPMQLMFRPAGDAVMPDIGTVEALVHALYFEKYNAVNKISTKTLRDLL